MKFKSSFLLVLFVLLLSSSAYANLYQDNIFYYEMQETTGTNVADLIFPVTQDLNSSSLIVSGIVNNARLVNGTTNISRFNSNFNINNSQDMTINFWYKRNSEITTGAEYLFQKRANTTATNSVNYYAVYEHNGGNRRIGFFKSADGSITNGTYFNYNLSTGWNMLTFSFNGTNLLLYANGTLRNTTTATRNVGVIGNPQGMIFGGTLNPADTKANGTYDEIRGWNVSLSNSFISLLYDSVGTNNFTIIARDALNSSIINNVHANISYNGILYNYSSSNGIIVTGIPGNVSSSIYINVSSLGYATNRYTIYNPAINGSTLNSQMLFANSILITFRDEMTNALINNVSLQAISNEVAYNRTTTNGTIDLLVIIPSEYTLRYSSLNYSPRFSYYDLTNNSAETITLYLLNSSLATNLTTTVIDSTGDNIENALVKVLKYDIGSNGYVLRESAVTNYNGIMVSSIVIASEFYKFIVEYPIGTVVLETNPSYIYGSSLGVSQTLVIPSNSSINPDQNDLPFGNVSFNQATNNFRYTYSDSTNSITQGCLYLYRVYLTEQELINTSCSSSSAATILLYADNISGSTYNAVGIATIDGEEFVHDQESWTYYVTNPFGNFGLFIGFIAIVVAVFMFSYNPAISLFMMGAAILLLSLTNVLVFSAWLPYVLFVLCVVMAITISRRFLV